MKNKILASSLRNFGADTRGLPDNSIVERKQFYPEIGVDEDKTVVAVMSSNTCDADGDVILAEGCDLSRFQKNPACFWSHDYSIPPVAKVTEIQLTEKGLVGKMKFADTAFAQEIFSLVKGGFLKTCSVGFLTLEEVRAGTRGFKEYCTLKGINSPNCKRIVTKWLMLENSLVGIPSNPDALVEAVSQKSLKLSDKTIKALGVDMSKKSETAVEVPVPLVISKEDEEIEEVKEEEVITLSICKSDVIIEDDIVGIKMEGTDEVVKLRKKEGTDYYELVPIEEVKEEELEDKEEELEEVKEELEDKEEIIDPKEVIIDDPKEVVEPIEEVKEDEEVNPEPVEEVPEAPVYVVVRNGDTEISVDMQKQLIRDTLKDLNLVKRGKIL